MRCKIACCISVCFALSVVSVSVALPVTNYVDGVVDTIQDLESLFREHQTAYLPVSPPSEEVFVQDYGLAVPFRTENLPRKFLKRFIGELNADLIPIYRLSVHEDPVSRETVFINVDGQEIYRLAPSSDYDPLAWQILRFDLSERAALDEWTAWIFDPAHIAADFTLVPELFYADYVMLGEQPLLMQEGGIMAMEASGPPPPPANTNTASTNASVKLTHSMVEWKFPVPEGFGSYAEIFQSTNLSSFTWEIIGSRIAVTGGTELAWTDTTSSNIPMRFYILSDATDDQDGDGYSDAREHYVEGTNPNVFDWRDSDGDGLHDWYEILWFGHIASQSGLDDYDGDSLPNAMELELTPSNVVFHSDPMLSDTDGGGLDDGFETTHSVLGFDPLDPADDAGDFDHDGLGNLEEYILGTEIGEVDTDGDGVNDGAEVAWTGTLDMNGDPVDPKVANVWDWEADIDGDGLSLLDEYIYGTDPVAPDAGQTNGVVDVAVHFGEIEDSGGYQHWPKWEYHLVLKGERTIALTSAPGETYTGTVKLKKGRSYEILLSRIDRDPAYPEWGRHYVATLTGPGIVAIDDVPLLGYHTDGDDIFDWDENTLHAKVHTVDLMLNATNTTLTLKHDNQRDLTVSARPESLAFSDYGVEIRLAYTNQWWPLGSGTNVAWTARVPGDFKLRAKASYNGEWFYSDVADALVQFPSQEQIISDATVSNAMEAAWQQTLVACTATNSYEYAFVIYLNTIDNVYETDASYPGPEILPGGWPSVIVTFVFKHIWYSSWIAGERYVVAGFHTHPPYTYAPSGERSTGASPDDLNSSNETKVPGFIYDYDAVSLYPGHSMTNSASVKPYGPERRILLDAEKY